MNELRPIIKWVEPEEISGVYTYEYWNDIEEEKVKEWWQLVQDRNKLMSYLKDTGLSDEFAFAAELLLKKDLLGARILDAAAGNCWTSALLSKFDEAIEIDALEFSSHRLAQLAPLVFDRLSAKKSKIQRVLGSFYDIKRNDAYYDLVFMSHAFHHADNPFRLLLEFDRILKPGGCIAFTGEPFVGWAHYIKKIIKSLVINRKLELDFYSLFETDNRLGDHFYRPSDYRFMFRTMGYTLNQYKTPGLLILIAQKPVNHSA